MNKVHACFVSDRFSSFRRENGYRRKGKMRNPSSFFVSHFSFVLIHLLCNFASMAFISKPFPCCKNADTNPASYCTIPFHCVLWISSPFSLSLFQLFRYFRQISLHAPVRLSRAPVPVSEKWAWFITTFMYSWVVYCLVKSFTVFDLYFLGSTLYWDTHINTIKAFKRMI